MKKDDELAQNLEEWAKTVGLTKREVPVSKEEQEIRDLFNTSETVYENFLGAVLNRHKEEAKELRQKYQNLVIKRLTLGLQTGLRSENEVKAQFEGLKRRMSDMADILAERF